MTKCTEARRLLEEEIKAVVVASQERAQLLHDLREARAALAPGEKNVRD